MRILGVNTGRAAPVRIDPDLVRPLADGSAALLTDGRISCATIEERHSRTRYSGGFARSTKSCLEAGAVDLNTLDAIGMSTCCDSRWDDPDDRVDALVEAMPEAFVLAGLRDALRSKTHCIDHHDSHAMLGFAGSGYRRALVCVADGFGNRRGAEAFDISSNWWRGSFDRQTFYCAEWQDGRVRLERIDEVGAGPDDVALAEAYRSVTHFLGWQSYQHTGKTMALAGYGDPERFARLDLVTYYASGGFKVNLPSLHDDPREQLGRALTGAGYPVPEDLKRPATPDEPYLADLAARIQSQLEQALATTVDTLTRRLGVRDVAFSGGLFLNCVALGKLAAARPDLRLYVPPAPSDTGQGLGNALWLAYAERSPVREHARFRGITSAGLGPRLAAASINRAVEDAASRNAIGSVRRLPEMAALARETAKALAGGAIIGVRRGRAEYGPRALGHCSILADARNPSAQLRLNAIKRREGFRPFAASVLAGHQASCFTLPTRSPFMSFAGAATPSVRNAAPGVVHIDGTTRYQTVMEDRSFLAAVLTAFLALTGVPLLLNTSFNVTGEPMVETAEDAFDVFERVGLDALVIGNLFVERAVGTPA
jgi:carbamoyltransferase